MSSAILSSRITLQHLDVYKRQVHPIPKTYLKELIVCAEKIVENPLYGTPEKNHMSDQIAYRAFYKKASILYTMDRVTGEKAPQE